MSLQINNNRILRHITHLTHPHDNSLVHQHITFKGFFDAIKDKSIPKHRRLSPINKARVKSPRRSLRVRVLVLAMDLLTLVQTVLEPFGRDADGFEMGRVVGPLVGGAEPECRGGEDGNSSGGQEDDVAAFGERLFEFAREGCACPWGVVTFIVVLREVLVVCHCGGKDGEGREDVFTMKCAYVLCCGQ